MYLLNMFEYSNQNQMFIDSIVFGVNENILLVYLIVLNKLIDFNEELFRGIFRELDDLKDRLHQTFIYFYKELYNVYDKPDEEIIFNLDINLEAFNFFNRKNKWCIPIIIFCIY